MTYTINFEMLTDEQKENLASAYDIEVSELEERDYEIEFESLSEEQIDKLVEDGELYHCMDCGDAIERGDEYEIRDDDDDPLGYVCDNCYRHGDYGECDDTGNYYRTRDLITLNYETRHERIVFSGSEAADDSYVCDDCGERYEYEYTVSDNWTTLCQGCYEDNYVTCEHCGTIVRDYDACYDDDSGYYYCQDCYDEYVRNDDEEDYDDDDNAIADYHHDNRQSTLTFRKMDDEPDTITEFLGVELEVEANDSPYNSQLNSRARAVKDVVPWTFMIKHDGSLTNGYEMVTDPCSLRFHLEKMPWAEICQVNLDNNMLSDKASNCGLHVHISRKALGDTEEEQDMTTAKLIILFERFEPEIEKFARRRNSSWASFYKFKANKENFDEVSKEMYEDLRNKQGNYNRERYHAINLTNTYTIEFRAFKGSLNVETVKATIEFVHEVVAFAKASSLIRVQNCVWTDICHNTEYPELKSYLKRRNLFWNGCNDD